MASTLLFRLLAVSILISSKSIAAAASRQVVHYEPAIVSLVGTLETQTFAGPPNYESIVKGDKIEAGWYLRLDKPIDVIDKAEGDGGSEESERNVRVVQVVVNNDKIWKELRDGRRCKLRGVLFHRVTGHHHARVLIRAEELLNE